MHPFSKKYIDLILVLFSLAPVLTHYFLGQMGVNTLLAIWISAVVFAYGLRNIIVHFNFASHENNHFFAIPLAIISPFLTFLITDFGADTIVLLYQILAFLGIMTLIALVWQQKISTIPLLVIGFIIGLISTQTPYFIFLLLLTPVFLYILQAWSGPNLGSTFTGFVLAVWLVYVFKFFVFDEASANAIFVSCVDFVDNLLVFDGVFSIIELIFIVTVVLLIIIYYIYGYFFNAAKTVKAHAFFVTSSVFSFLLAIFAIVDISHLPYYASLISIIFAFQLSIQQSCSKDATTEWWILSILFGYVLISVFMPIFHLLY